jgi:peptidoglycan/xylan/chitin deacetylase (PgdA/CDA1 family)
MVALTFDDGPDATATLAVLVALEAADVTATFFVVAEQIEQPEGPALLRATMYGGHAIQAHCGRHNSHCDQTGEQIAADTRSILDALARHGVPAPCLWRPPYGLINDEYSCPTAATARSTTAASTRTAHG